jgi:hypothetical protein
LASQWDSVNEMVEWILADRVEVEVKGFRCLVRTACDIKREVEGILPRDAEERRENGDGSDRGGDDGDDRKDEILS